MENGATWWVPCVCSTSSLYWSTFLLESVMDNILHPELRDRMILLRGKHVLHKFLDGIAEHPPARYSLPDCLIDYRRSIMLHGDDVLAHNNWEISEPFLRQYRWVWRFREAWVVGWEIWPSFLIDPATLNITNRWRKERGEPEFRLSELTGSDSVPSVPWGLFLA